MKNIAPVTVACLASAAFAGGEILTVTLDFAADSIAVGESTTATLTVGLSGWGPDAYFSSIVTHMIASGDFVAVSGISGLEWANPILGGVSTGTPSGSSIMGIFGAQMSLFGPVDQSNPLHLLSFTVTGVAPGVLSYTFEGDIANGGVDGPFLVTDPTTNPFAIPWFPLEPLYELDVLTVTPAPSGLALLGLGVGLGRRRR